jgi:tRNA dimethylallyltransferase
MMKNGLLDEVSANKKYRDKVALKTIGYREFFEYFDGKVTYDNAVEKFKQHSRNYAKRQITWFKRDKDVVWISPIKREEIFEAIEKFIS